MKKTSSLPIALALLTASIAFIFSCKKTDFSEIQAADHESEWAVPLFKTSIGIEDLLQKTLVDTAAKLLIAPDGKMTFYFQGDLAAKYATELDEKFAELPGVGVFFPQTDTTVALPSPDKLRIRKVLLKSGFMIPTVAPLFPAAGPTVVEVTIPQLLTPDGQSFVHKFTVPVGTSGLWMSPDTVFIDNYKIEAPKDSFSFSYKAWDQDGNPALFLGCALLMQQFKFKYAEGFWESTSYPLSADTIPIDIYSFVAGGGRIQFDDPRVTAYILNSFGFPTRAQINALKMVLKDGSEVEFQGQAVDDGINAVYPTLPNEVGQTKVTEFYFDQTNSNIKDIFNAQPVSLIYDFNGISNPDNDPNFVGFITDESKVLLRVRVELPLRAYAKDFVVEDTLAVDFGGYSTLETGKVREAEFKIITENEMPVALATQILFLDSQNQPVDSLFTTGETVFLGPAPVDNDGNVTGKTVNELKIPLSAERFERIRAATHILLRARFNTSGGDTQPVTALQKQRTSIRMGMKVTLFD